MTSDTPVVILAGGKAKPAMAAAMGVDNRALMRFGNGTMLDAIVAAFASAKSIGKIVVVGNVPNSPSYELVADHGGFVDNIFAGLSRVEGIDHAIISTSDIPFITSAGVDDYCIRATEANADMVYPIVRAENCRLRFPGVKRTTLKLKEGEFTGGNMVMARVPFMEAQRDRIADAYSARKSPVRLAALIGLGTTLKLLVNVSLRPGILSVAELEQSVSRLLNGNVQALTSEYAEIATDIDKPDDIEAIKHAAVKA